MSLVTLQLFVRSPWCPPPKKPKNNKKENTNTNTNTMLCMYAIPYPIFPVKTCKIPRRGSIVVAYAFPFFLYYYQPGS